MYKTPSTKYPWSYYALSLRVVVCTPPVLARCKWRVPWYVFSVFRYITNIGWLSKPVHSSHTGEEYIFILDSYQYGCYLVFLVPVGIFFCLPHSQLGAVLSIPLKCRSFTLAFNIYKGLKGREYRHLIKVFKKIVCHWTVNQKNVCFHVYLLSAKQKSEIICGSILHEKNSLSRG